MNGTAARFFRLGVGQASIVALNNLYSGCGGTVPSVYWAYNTSGSGIGQILMHSRFELHAMSGSRVHGGNMCGPSSQDCEKSFARTGVPSANMLAKRQRAAANLVQIRVLPASAAASAAGAIA